MRKLKPTFSALSHARPALWVGVPLSLVVGLTFYYAIASSIENDSRRRFAQHAQNARNTIDTRIKSYNDLLRGTVSLFQVSDPVDRKQFHSYVKGLGLETNYPAIISINYAVQVSDAERDRFEQRVRLERLASGRSLSDFSITPPGRRDIYVVTTFIEPAGRWDQTLGMDLHANRLVRKTLGQLRDSGKLTTSGMPISFISKPNLTVLAMRLPVYRAHAPTGNVAERRAAYIGSVGMAFSVPLLVQGVIDEIPIPDVRMTLVDHAIGVDSRRGRVLIDSGGKKEHEEEGFSWWPTERFSTSLPIDFNGRHWNATFSVSSSNMYTGFEGFIPWMALLAGFVSSMLLYALFHALASSRKRAIRIATDMTSELRDSQARLQLSHQNLRRLAAHADQIKEGERKRIAREIHDDLGQNLLALRIEADMLCARTGKRHPRLHARARLTVVQIDATIRSVRQLINDLRPNVLDLGLAAAVEWQIAEFERRTGIACELVDAPHEQVLDDHAATAFFRILQESLSNILRHAQASHVRIELTSDGAQLSMTVSDNGIGLAASARCKSGSFGLVGIEERVNILGGSCSISSHGGQGTTVRVSVPIQNNTIDKLDLGPLAQLVWPSMRLTNTPLS